MSQVNIGSLGDLAGATTVPIEDVINGSARAWVNFNGTGTVAIRADYNVDGITDVSTGRYTVNYTDALTDANYVFLGNASDVGSTANNDRFVEIRSLTNSAVEVNVFTGANTSIDVDYISVAVFR